jgi:phage terminase small subunit
MTKRDRRRRGPSAIEDVAARAARLGITPDRVLQEYARIAFADLRRIADWGPGEDGLKINPSDELDPADAAAIAEIVVSAATGRVYRIKLHDKTPVLGALARHLHMLKTEPNEDEQTENDGESARQLLIREFDRLAVETAEGSGAPEPEK